MKRAYQPSDRDCKKPRSQAEQPDVFFKGKRYTLWKGATEPFIGKRYYLPVFKKKDVNRKDFLYAKGRFYIYALNPNEVATPFRISYDLYTTACRFTSEEYRDTTVRELDLVLAFHSEQYRGHLLNYVLCSLLERARDSIPTEFAKYFFEDLSTAVKGILAVSLLKTYSETDLFASVWSNNDKKLTTPHRVYLEVLEKLRAAEPHVLKLWKEEEELVEQTRAMYLRTGRRKVVKNFVQPVLDYIAKWRALSNYGTCKATGVCLRRRKVPRLIVDLILKRISQQ